MQLPISLPGKGSVVRCRLPYPHLNHPANTHPALVLNSIEAGRVPSLKTAVLIVAGGTSVFDSNNVRKKLHRGEVAMSIELSLSAGLSKETKFCFAPEAIFAFPFDDSFFPYDASKVMSGYPIFGKLNTSSSHYQRFETLRLDSHFADTTPSQKSALKALLSEGS
ncbi:TPA: hypothetical protein QEM92_002707 [Stenotrophomonas maltophilia]|uniref:hypothetical protein n=1 Tax=Stenotrophomonas maltophilia TaxID=40324 RepID=UPI0013D9AE93|nr:hypothetical protein [Stenotrophomonas maltophilia]HDS1832059.1 hypothetical protein [Stenotrophomonas maltophilia]